jgi:hypothetical protein
MFETNSSGSHAICIKGGDYEPYYWLKEKDGFVEIKAGEFGWEEEKSHGWDKKASYCLTYAKSIEREDLVEMLRGVISKTTGVSDVRFAPYTPGGEYDEWGYIDHQSSDVCAEAFESEEILRAFIFNPKSFLVIDHDNR